MSVMTGVSQGAVSTDPSTITCCFFDLYCCGPAHIIVDQVDYSCVWGSLYEFNLQATFQLRIWTLKGETTALMCRYCQKQPVRASLPTGAVSDVEHVTFEACDCLSPLQCACFCITCGSSTLAIGLFSRKAVQLCSHIDLIECCQHRRETASIHGCAV